MITEDNLSPPNKIDPGRKSASQIRPKKDDGGL